MKLFELLNVIFFGLPERFRTRKAILSLLEEDEIDDLETNGSDGDLAVDPSFMSNMSII
jgi:hypothetical protein